MQIDIQLSEDVIESKDDLKKFLDTIFTDNFNKIINSIDATKMSAKLGFDSTELWDTFTNQVKEDISTAIEKHQGPLVKETSVEEENPDETTGTNESLSFRELLLKKLDN